MCIRDRPGGGSYKRIVNIYSGSNANGNQNNGAGQFKNKRKSQHGHAAETRVTLNHSMLPNHNVQGKIGQYDRGYHEGANIMLPEIPGGYSKHIASQHKVAYDAG